MGLLFALLGVGDLGAIMYNTHWALVIRVSNLGFLGVLGDSGLLDV